MTDEEIVLQSKLDVANETIGKLRAALAESHANELARFGELQAMGQSAAALECALMGEVRRLQLRLLVKRCEVLLWRINNHAEWRGYSPRDESRLDRVRRIFDEARAVLEAGR